jgi:hypothetical protein
MSSHEGHAHDQPQRTNRRLHFPWPAKRLWLSHLIDERAPRVPADTGTTLWAFAGRGIAIPLVFLAVLALDIVFAEVPEFGPVPTGFSRWISRPIQPTRFLVSIQERGPPPRAPACAASGSSRAECNART